jgi:hypothetical protein
MHMLLVYYAANLVFPQQLVCNTHPHTTHGHAVASGQLQQLYLRSRSDPVATLSSHQLLCKLCSTKMSPAASKPPQLSRQPSCTHVHVHMQTLP